MSNASNKKIELTEIADYRGNLSFAEENNPIPFAIKSIFWTTISQDISLCIKAQSFIIVLDGKVEINSVILDKPCQAYLADYNSNLELSLLSEEAIILIVMDKTIGGNDDSVNDGDLLKMPTLQDFNGLKGYYANSNSTLPFDIKRVYFTYSIPDNAKRGGHAHIYTKEIVFPLKGQFDIVVEDKEHTETFHLNKENEGIFLDTGIWRELENFTNQSLVLVLASESYYEADYIREHDKFEEKYK